MSKTNQKLGKMGEDIAAEFFEARGFIVLERNYRTSTGEIDLIVRKDDLIVFVEVKTRTSTRYGLPEEAITSTKQEHMVTSAEEYILSHPENSEFWRLDVLSILINQHNGNPQIEWFENAIS
jgi:putative endonuclease